jgi:hypothetical protein
MVTQQGDSDVASLRMRIAEMKDLLQADNDQVQASVDMTKVQNDQNQEQFDQNKILNRFRSKVLKSFDKNSKNNNKYIGSVNKLETIGYGYKKTFNGKIKNCTLTLFPAHIS